MLEEASGVHQKMWNHPVVIKMICSELYDSVISSCRSNACCWMDEFTKQMSSTSLNWSVGPVLKLQNEMGGA